MLTVSREAAVKVGKHAWNVFPLEAFGYLLGRAAERQVLAALPCSKTKHWHEFDDRWTGIEEHLEKACTAGKVFNLEVIGFYASTESDRRAFPMPSFVDSSHFVMVYRTMCCPRCSRFSFKYNNRRLDRGDGFILSRGKRFDDSVNQKKVLRAWRRIYGPVDCSNLSCAPCMTE